VTPVPTPAGRELGSGTFRSNTGVPINLVCSWSARTSGSDTVQLTVSVALESYSLFVNAHADALCYTVNGSTTTANVAALSIDTNNVTHTELGQKTFTVNLSDGETVTVPVTVEWLFGGVYSGVQLDRVTAETDIILNR
jgi:6-phosphogluconolactonase (cycloisomerase 2 family)